MQPHHRHDHPATLAGQRGRSRRRPRTTIQRRRVAGLLLVLLVLAGAGAALSTVAQPDLGDRARSGSISPRLTIRDGRRVLVTLGLDRFRGPGGSLDRGRLAAAVRRRVPSWRHIVRRRATLTYRLDGEAATRWALALGPSGGTVRLRRTPAASLIDAPVVRQRLRNICEATALQILLATTGVEVDQLQIQARLPRSGALDPQDTATGRVWGDPALGFVGRADGGGVAGGFGVYQRPIAKVARRYGRGLEDLTGFAANRIYNRLLQGRAVMAWVGLSEGPYGEWRSPQGRQVRVNFGEHTVVLVGVRADGMLRVVNPLNGTAELWSKGKFEGMWALLGRRALAT